jgi:hypothetical protein
MILVYKYLASLLVQFAPYLLALLAPKEALKLKEVSILNALKCLERLD